MIANSLSLEKVIRYPVVVPIDSARTRRKTSFEVDPAKVAVAKEILGTTTLTETVDAALTEVAKLAQRRRLAALLFTTDALELDDPDVMSGAWR